MGTPSFLWRKAKNVQAWTLGNREDFTSEGTNGLTAGSRRLQSLNFWDFCEIFSTADQYLITLSVFGLRPAVRFPPHFVKTHFSLFPKQSRQTNFQLNLLFILVRLRSNYKIFHVVGHFCKKVSRNLGYLSNLFGT